MTPLKGRHQKTLEQIFSTPVSGTVRYDDVESMLRYLGAELSTKGKTSGSRICFTIMETKVILHKPHPGNELDKGAVKQLRLILEKLGIVP